MRRGELVNGTLVTVTTRPVTAADDSLLRSIYASTRRVELESAGWPSTTVETFVTQQFGAQQHHYAVAYPAADHRVIVADGHDVGQVMIDSSSDPHTVIDISMFEHAQGRGIGTAILREAIDAADRAGRDTTLSVLNDSPARRLYARLGFSPTSSDAIRTTMRRAALRKDTT